MDSNEQIPEEVDTDSDDDSEEDDTQTMADINRLQEELSINCFDYSKHTKLIEKLESCGELELLRRAREKMSSVYPLSPKLWLNWINDEMRIATNEDEKKAVLELFERSVADYVAIDLWLEYIQYAIGLMDPLGVDGVRRIFERSLTFCGLNVDKGVLVWQTFREFETFILESMASDVDSDDRKRQIDRIFDLFRRQLSLPLEGMDNTFTECDNWCQTVRQKYSIDVKFDGIKTAYEKAFNQLQTLMPYEESLRVSEAPHLDQYYRYIEYETINGSPMRVQSIYERALNDNCLVADLWHKYTAYLDKKVVIDSILLPVYQRAVRNCTWSSTLWISYLKALERLKAKKEKVMEVFETGLQMGFQEPNEYLQIWLTFFDYLRRNTNWKDEIEVKTLRKTFEKAIEHLSQIDGSDPNCSLTQYWAKIEAKFCADIERARQLWNQLMTSRHDISALAHNWLSYSRLERVFGDEKHYRKVLLRGLSTVTDWPESVGQILLEFEREEGVSIEDFDEVNEKYEKVMIKVNEKRMKIAEKETKDKNERKTQKGEPNRASKRRAEHNVTQSDRHLDSDGFKVPQSSSSVSAPKKAKQDSHPKRERRDERPKADEPAHGVTYRSDGSKDLQTVFVSNLDFNTKEEQLREAFGKFGQINDLRLVRNYKGLSKGYAYVEYETIESVNEALKHDRMPLEGRPAFISRVGKRTKFGFSTSVERHKLFVKNIPLEVKNEELKTIFEKYGSLKDVRLVTYRNGHSKGCAYVEYEDQSSAQEALKHTDGLLVGEKNIVVAISNPNERPRAREDESNGKSVFDQESRYSKTRINAPMIPMAVRVQRRAHRDDSDHNRDNGATSADNKALSNSDFRSMLLGSK